jgi:L,D-peptidoglycan transpeptidase YkuD (ErfK/YbiS/YcfS/YnhG family)
MTVLRTDGARLEMPDGSRVACAMGRNGLIPADEKREGDGATPIGRWRLTRVLYRPDRIPEPTCALPTAPLSPRDGWCDDPKDPAYNTSVTLPYPASHEEMWRADGLYDVVVETDHNTDPVVPGMGSAIFLHCRNPSGLPTAGCIAVDRDVLIALLAAVDDPAWLEIIAPL